MYVCIFIEHRRHPLYHQDLKCMYVYVCMYVCMYAVTSDLVVKLADLGEARDVSRANETAKFMPR